MSSQNSWSSSVSHNNKNGGKEKLTKMENMKMGVMDFLGPLTRQQMSNILPESIPIKAVNDLGKKSWLLLSADTVDFWNIDLKQGIPAMNVCLSASSKLYCLLEKLSKDGKRNIEPAVKWQNFGIFNR